MKWEEYDKMSSKHKEEFDYRFKRDRIEQPIHITWLLVMKTIIISEMVTVLGAYYIPALESLRVYTENLLIITTLLTGVMVVIVLVQILSWLIDMGWYEYKKRRWLKERGYK